MLLTDDLLLDYKRCQRRAFLNIYGNPLERDAEREFLLKLRQESYNHIKNVLADFYPHFQRPSTLSPTIPHLALATESLMAKGVDCIYQGILEYHLSLPQPLTLVGKPHLLIKQAGKSRFGNWLYTPVSIQLGRRPKPEYKLVSAFHAYLLKHIQGVMPPYSEIILRRQNHHRLELGEWLPKLEEVLGQWVQMLRQAEEPEVFISRQRCTLCHWHTHCYSIAQAQKHLSLVPGVTPSRYESLQILGVNTLELLAAACPINLGEVMGLEVARQLQQQAQALLENRAFFKIHSRPLSLPTAPIELYFDIEAEPEQNLDYLLGVLYVDRLHHREEFYPFLAKSPEDEPLIWQNFLDFMQLYPHAPIFHFSEYEVETIKRLAQLYKTPRKQVEPILSRCLDLHRQVTQTVTFPVESYSLKALANWIGFQWRDQGVSGDQCVCWYDQWLKTQDPIFLASILRYNEDDCWATFYLKNWLVKFFQDANPSAS
jgi:uncharacterized protein